jgi:hypothetical protein
MRAKFIIVDDKGKESVIVDKTLTGGKRNVKGNVTFVTTGFGIPTGHAVNGDPLYLGILLQTRKVNAGGSSLID